MNQVLFEVNAVSAMIRAGESLILAGDEQVLSQLPKGTWIGGTIPYFVGNEGGEFSRNKIFVTRLPANLPEVGIRVYDEKSIGRVYQEAPENGLSFIILPAASAIHQEFSLRATTFEGFASKPLIGWVSGVALEDFGKIPPKVFVGRDLRRFDNAAVVLSMQLPPSMYANIGIINLFEEGVGDTLFFPEDGFVVKDVIINDKTVNFADYLKNQQIDIKYPLVADAYGVKINTSFQSVNAAAGTVSLYAPAFRGVAYKIARPVQNYVEHFRAVMPQGLGQPAFFSCNCILNYLYSELEGQKTGDLTGPVTFGEVAYQLLNQTLVYVTLEKMPEEEAGSQALLHLLSA
jgi:hypothetical protein